jgi:hypothetical protein
MAESIRRRRPHWTVFVLRQPDKRVHFLARLARVFERLRMHWPMACVDVARKGAGMETEQNVGFVGSTEELQEIVVHRAEQMVEMLKSGQMKFFMAVAIGEEGVACFGCQIEIEAWRERMRIGMDMLMQQYQESLKRMDEAVLEKRSTRH